MPHTSPAARRAYQNARNARLRGKPPVLPEPDAVPDPAESFFRWAERTLKVPTGPLRGKPWRIPEWQRVFFRAALEPGVREAGLSCSRRLGKTGSCAALLLCYLIGPLNSPLWRGIVVSLNGILARELRDAVTLISEASGLRDQLEVYRSPSPGRILGLRGARLDVLSS